MIAFQQLKLLFVYSNKIMLIILSIYELLYNYV